MRKTLGWGMGAAALALAGCMGQVHPESDVATVGGLELKGTSGVVTEAGQFKAGSMEYVGAGDLKSVFRAYLADMRKLGWSSAYDDMGDERAVATLKKDTRTVFAEFHQTETGIRAVVRASTPRLYHGTDVVEVPELDLKSTSGVQKSGGQLSSGTLEYVGQGDLKNIFRNYLADMVQQGWTSAHDDIQADKAMGTLVKDVRVCQVEFTRNSPNLRALIKCSSPKLYLGADVVVPADMQLKSSGGVQKAGGQLLNGTLEFTGGGDVRTSFQSYLAAMTAQGWTSAHDDISDAKASGTLRKDNRVCTVEFTGAGGTLKAVVTCKGPKFYPDTDVLEVPGFELRGASDVQKWNGLLHTGVLEFTGQGDLKAIFRGYLGLLTSNGWVSAYDNVADDKAVGTLRKDNRTCSLEFVSAGTTIRATVKVTPTK